jgi:hypothetical protein
LVLLALFFLDLRFEQIELRPGLGVGLQEHPVADERDGAHADDEDDDGDHDSF